MVCSLQGDSFDRWISPCEGPYSCAETTKSPYGARVHLGGSAWAWRHRDRPVGSSLHLPWQHFLADAGVDASSIDNQITRCVPLRLESSIFWDHACSGRVTCRVDVVARMPEFASTKVLSQYPYRRLLRECNAEPIWTPPNQTDITSGPSIAAESRILPGRWSCPR